MNEEPFMVVMPRDRFDRIAAVVRAAVHGWDGLDNEHEYEVAMDDLTPDDIEAVGL